jgi:hypothetical protein
MSKMFIRHIWILVFRVFLLAAALYLYFFDKDKLDFTKILHQDFGGGFLYITWLVLVIGMIYRIFPNKHIAIGARKHYACSHNADTFALNNVMITSAAKKRLNKGVFLCASAWILFNIALFLLLYLCGILTTAVIIIIVLAYAVCDIICILMFCPFKSLFMRNKCCAVCRIYNWDYFMICTPLILFPCLYSLSLFLLSVVVLFVWEISFKKNPHFFMEDTNKNLRCENCKERLCLINKRLNNGGLRQD